MYFKKKCILHYCIHVSLLGCHLSVKLFELHKPAWILIYWPHFNFVPIFHVHQIWRGTTTHQIRWHSHKKNLPAPGVALKSPANQWGWCCDACEETLTWFIIVIAKEQEGAMNWNSYVSVETSACRLCHVFLSRPPKCCVNINQPSYSLFLFVFFSIYLGRVWRRF